MEKLLLWCTLGVLYGATLSEGQGARRVQYEHFDDYLISVLAPRDRPHNEVLKQGATTTTTTPGPTTTGHTPSSVDILGYFRDVPREHWSCCMLGKLAGDKGFHCHAGFYAARITTRNPNRAHNRRMHFHGRGRIPNWGTNIMRVFQRCVSPQHRHAQEFHKCCYAAAVERRELSRWIRYRNRQTQNS